MSTHPTHAHFHTTRRAAVATARPLAVLATAALVCAGVIAPLVTTAGCATEELAYDANRGTYLVDEIEIGSGGDPNNPSVLTRERGDQLLVEGEQLEADGNLATAIAHYSSIRTRWPQSLTAMLAQIRLIELFVDRGNAHLARNDRDKADIEFRTAHQQTLDLVTVYKEALAQTAFQPLWEQIRRTWYARIGLGLLYDSQTREAFVDDPGDAREVFERLLQEEFRGPYAALCLLRIGDCYMIDRDFARARTHYLRVVEDYPDYQQFAEHEEALLKAARATLGTSKGAEYDIETITSPGSEISESGALDLINDYLANYPDGHFLAEVRTVRTRIFNVLAWRDLDAGIAYDRLDEHIAARTQYEFVVRKWGDATAFPDQQVYVREAQEALDRLGGPVLSPQGDDAWDVESNRASAH